MSDRTFFDTNVLVYLFDDDAPAKQATARELLETHGPKGEAIVSTQVLQEFYVAVTRKLGKPVAPEIAEAAVASLAEMPTIGIDSATILAAISLSRRDRLSFWDSLIIQAAIAGGCSTLLTEDLQAGRRIDSLLVVNPFAA
jgi:predicted nucleic acid-binding protein